jgi:hypothetical protein
MCVSTDRAEFSGTTLYAGRRHHPQHGLIHVLGYQNTAANLATGPNAMLLHLPAIERPRSALIQPDGVDRSSQNSPPGGSPLSAEHPNSPQTVPVGGGTQPRPSAYSQQ